jgi:PII-like signaling protein
MSYGPHLEMTVLVAEHAHFHRTPLYSEIVHRARKNGLAGASVFRGIEGFGHSLHVHEARIIDFGAHMPVIIVIIDAEARIRGFLPEVQELVGEAGLITIRPVEMLAPAVGRR